MAGVTLRGIGKSYGSVDAVGSVDLDIEDGSFVALLGPSGCGKTTLLRMISGLETPSRGRMTIGDEVVCDVENKVFMAPEKRRVGMVFQSYAVWPHMSVEDNVGYPLKIRGIRNRGEKIQEALALVQMDHLARRMPDQLSGGQQQRIALARALVMEPRVLLLDEPLSNLDVHLKDELRREISRLRKRLNMTMIHVTHDQSEALALADTLVVLRSGAVEQVGSGRDVFERPESAFVGEFVSRADRLEGVWRGEDGGCVALNFGEGGDVRLPEGVVRVVGGGMESGARVDVLVRGAVDARLVGDDQDGVRGVVEGVVYAGGGAEYEVWVEGAGRLRVPGRVGEAEEGEGVVVGLERVQVFAAP